MTAATRKPVAYELIIGVFIGLLLLYVLGYGPACYVNQRLYYTQRFVKVRWLIKTVYIPFEHAAAATPIGPTFGAYGQWFQRIAVDQFHANDTKTPPTPP